jgi:hypothetical protein
MVSLGENMYGTLSGEIHHYGGSGEYDVPIDKWGPIPRAILLALQPDPKNVDKEGAVDWIAEKNRY